MRFRGRSIWLPAKLLFGGAVAFALLQAAPALVTANEPVAATTSAKAEPADGAQASLLERTLAPDPAPPSTATLAGIEVRRELAIDHWLRPGEYAWEDEGAPAGPAVIVVNIRARILSVYRGGVEIGRSSLIYGADNKPTPFGTFPILEKDADHVSNLFEAPMPHMLRLTWDGVAIHGSPELRDDLGTRGCVGLPREFAALLFDVVRVGDRVVVWDGVTSA